jgi:hypothetical protein
LPSPYKVEVLIRKYPQGIKILKIQNVYHVALVFKHAQQQRSSKTLSLKQEFLNIVSQQLALIAVLDVHFMQR